jgi:hypothetical protein
MFILIFHVRFHLCVHVLVHVKVTFSCSIFTQRAYAARACSVDMQHGHEH